MFAVNYLFVGGGIAGVRRGRRVALLVAGEAEQMINIFFFLITKKISYCRRLNWNAR
jgi:hypothetical protein